MYQEKLKSLIESLSFEEKVFVALSMNQAHRNNNLMVDYQTNKLLVFCSKQHNYVDIIDELSSHACSNCKAASDYRSIKHYVDRYRSAIKKAKP